MLFDLRSRGRRRTVRVVYLGLAVLMGGGLVLFGVGTGGSGGGLLNAFTGNGSSGAQSQIISSQEKAALRQTRLSPTSSAAWADLVRARYESASSNVANFNSATGTFTTSGRRELAAAATAWQRYLQLTKSPDPTVAILAARAYGNLGQYADEASAWEIQTLASPNEAKGYECLAASAYAAGQTRKGDLARNKALTLVPQVARVTLKAQIQAAKTSPTIAASC